MIKINTFYDGKMIENLSIFVQSAKKRNTGVDSILFYNPYQVDMIQLAEFVANEMGSSLKVVSGPTIDSVSELASILTNLNKGDVLFIDEIHRIPRSVEEVIYKAAKNYSLDFILGKGPSARTMRLKLQPFTLIGATNEQNYYSSEFKNKNFDIFFKVDKFSRQSITYITKQIFGELGIYITDEACKEIALRSEGLQKNLNVLIKRILDYVEMYGEKNVDLNFVKLAIKSQSF